MNKIAKAHRVGITPDTKQQQVMQTPGAVVTAQRREFQAQVPCCHGYSVGWLCPFKSMCVFYPLKKHIFKLEITLYFLSSLPSYIKVKLYIVGNLWNNKNSGKRLIKVTNEFMSKDVHY